MPCKAVAKDTEIGCELPAMMRRMGNAAHEYPGSTANDIEKLRALLEPGFGHRLQSTLSGQGRRGVFLHELHSRLKCRQRRLAQIYSEKHLHPIIFAHALMDHLLVHTACARLRSPRHLFVLEHCPDTKNLLALSEIRIGDKGISIHDISPIRKPPPCPVA
jgi:hypothetical protein